MPNLLDLAFFVCVIASPAKVYDGDTFTCANGIKVRTWGVTMNELRDPGGVEARDWMRALLAGRTMRCYVRGVSRDRMVAQCFLAEDPRDVSRRASEPLGMDVAWRAVAAGQGRDCFAFSRGTYASAETEASRRLPLPGYCLPDAD